MSGTPYQNAKEFNKIKKELIEEKNHTRIPTYLRVYQSKYMYIFLVGYQTILLSVSLSINGGISQDSTFLFFMQLFPDYEVLGLLICILLLAVLTVGVSSLFLRYMLKTYVKKECLFLSVSAAEEIESGNLIKGAMLTRELLNKLGNSLSQQKVRVGTYRTNMKSVFKTYLDKLKNQQDAVAQAILEKDVPNIFFSDHLYNIAHSFFSENSDYSNGSESLKFLLRRSEKYFKKETFGEKHKTLEKFGKVIGETGKLVLVPILGFILWYFFQYSS